jgi:hypothetical protein
LIGRKWRVKEVVRSTELLDADISVAAVAAAGLAGGGAGEAAGLDHVEDVTKDRLGLAKVVVGEFDRDNPVLGPQVAEEPEVDGFLKDLLDHESVQNRLHPLVEVDATSILGELVVEGCHRAVGKSENLGLSQRGRTSPDSFTGGR